MVSKLTGRQVWQASKTSFTKSRKLVKLTAEDIDHKALDCAQILRPSAIWMGTDPIPVSGVLNLMAAWRRALRACHYLLQKVHPPFALLAPKFWHEQIIYAPCKAFQGADSFLRPFSRVYDIAAKIAPDPPFLANV